MADEKPEGYDTLDETLKVLKGINQRMEVLEARKDAAMADEEKPDTKQPTQPEHEAADLCGGAPRCL